MPNDYNDDDVNADVYCEHTMTIWGWWWRSGDYDNDDDDDDVSLWFNYFDTHDGGYNLDANSICFRQVRSEPWCFSCKYPDIVGVFGFHHQRVCVLFGNCGCLSVWFVSSDILDLFCNIQIGIIRLFLTISHTIQLGDWNGKSAPTNDVESRGHSGRLFSNVSFCFVSISHEHRSQPWDNKFYYTKPLSKLYTLFNIFKQPKLHKSGVSSFQGWDNAGLMMLSQAEQGMFATYWPCMLQHTDPLCCNILTRYVATYWPWKLRALFGTYMLW